MAIIAAFCAYVVKGMAGFANTLVFSSIMGFTTSNINISPVELVLGFPSNVSIAYRERASISVKVFLPLSIIVVAGVIPGALLLRNSDTQVIKLLFGFVVVSIAIEMFVREYIAKSMKRSRILLAVIGVVAGILCGLFGIGAFLAAYISRTTQNSAEFRGNICMVFVIENAFRIGIYAALGIINMEILKDAATLMPFMLAGLCVGLYLSKRVNEKVVKTAVIVLLLLSGVSLIYTNMIALV